MGYSYLKGRSDHSLTCHNSRKDGNDQTRVEHARRHRVEERVGIGTLVLADVRSLTDVLRMNQRLEDIHLCQIGESLPPAKDMEIRSTTTRAGWPWTTVKLQLTS